MKIQPFKSNEHVRADDPCTEQVQFFPFCMLKCIIVCKIQNRNTSTLRGTLLNVLLYFPLMNQEKVDEFINSFMIGLPFISQENPARGWLENLGVLDINVLTSLLHVHVRADDPCTEQVQFFPFCMLKCIIVYKIQNRNTSNLR